MRLAISSESEKSGKPSKCEEVATARSYRSCAAARAYNSNGNKGAYAARRLYRAVDGATCDFGSRPYVCNLSIAAESVGKGGE